MSRRSWLPLASLGVASLIGCWQQSDSMSGAPTATSAETATLEEYLNRVEAYGFAGSVIVGYRDEVILERGIGPRTCDGTATVDGESLYFVASLSKAFTAMAVLRSVERGDIDLSDGIAELLGHQVEVPAAARAITPLHLLTHRSGLAPLDLDQRERAKSAIDFVRVAFEKPLQFEPGERVRYSNTGYSLLAAAVELRSGIPFADFLADEVLEPAGLSSTTLVDTKGTSDTPAREPGKHHARACRAGVDQGGPLLSHRETLGFADLGAVGVVSNARDLSRWVRCLATDCLLAGTTRSTVDEQLAHARRTWNAPAGRGFGFGWVSDRTPHGEPRLWHDGLLLPEGWNGQIRLYPVSGLHLVVLSGQHAEQPRGWEVARNLERLIFGGSVDWPPSPTDGQGAGSGSPSAIEPGRYDLRGGGELEIVRLQNRYTLEPHGQAAVDLVRQASDEQRLVHQERNEASHDILSRLWRGDFEGVQKRYAGRPLEQWRPRTEKTLAWLAERFSSGATRETPPQIEVIHTVSLGEDGPQETYIRLVATATLAPEGETAPPLVLRVVWFDGRFVGMSDRGAFLGKTPSVEVLPGPIVLAGPSAEGVYRAWDAATLRSFEVRPLTKGEFEVHAGERIVIARLRAL